MTPEEGYQEALRRIEEARRAEATQVDLSRLRLTVVPVELADYLALQALYLSGNQISALENLPTSLQELNLSYNQISTLENLPASLQTLYFFQNPTRNIPSELLGKNMYDDCLATVKAWFADLEKESEPNQTVKFMVSGNSNVGKSSLIEALQTGKAQPGQASTHGIRIVSLPLTDGTQHIQGIAFDFGGQEIYHGTHQLFLRSRAVQLVVFDAETETTTLTADRRGVQGETNRNKTLPN